MCIIELTSDYYGKLVWTLDVSEKEEGSWQEGSRPVQTIAGQLFLKTFQYRFLHL